MLTGEGIAQPGQCVGFARKWKTTYPAKLGNVYPVVAGMHRAPDTAGSEPVDKSRGEEQWMLPPASLEGMPKGKLP